METGIALVIKNFPSLLATWVYPWIAQPMLVQYVGGLPNARFICDKLVASFSNPPATIDEATTVPEEAFALSVTKILETQGIVLTPLEMAPLMVALGTRGQADPSLDEPTA